LIIAALTSPMPTARVPRWYAAMTAAKSWGVPPWEVTGEELTQWTRRKWLLRFSWVNEKLAKVQAAKAKKRTK